MPLARQNLPCLNIRAHIGINGIKTLFYLLVISNLIKGKVATWA
jgi:hypothetical protein